MAPIPFVNQILVWITLFADVLIVYLVIELIYHKGKGVFVFDNVLRMIKKNSLFLMFLVSLVAMLGSLYYSDIAGFSPCKLCWYQRIFMYPQVFLLALAMWKRDKRIIPYTILLSVVGLVIAGYHYILQISQIDSVFCSLVGYSVSCSETFFLSLGYITIPMMALSAFALIILFGWILKK